MRSFRRVPRVFAVYLTALAAAGVVRAASLNRPELVISRPWSRPAAFGEVGVIYLTVTNRGPRDDTLISATSPAAARVSIHLSLRAGAVMTMRTLGSLAIPGGATVALAPNGLHLMLEGLKRSLRPGDRVPVILTFSRAGRLEVNSLVQAADGRLTPGMSI